MNHIIGNNKLCNIYLLFYLLYIVITTFSKFTAFSIYLYPIYHIIVIVSILFSIVVLCIIRDSRGYKSVSDYYFAIFVILVIILRIALNIQLITLPLISIYLFIANLRYLNLNLFIKYDYKIKLFFLIIIVFLYLCHLIPMNSINASSFRHGILRISAGFSDSNTFAGFIFALSLSYILYIGNKVFGLKHILFILFIYIFTFYVTDSRGLITSGIIIVFLLILKQYNVISKFIKVLSIIIIGIVPLSAILIPMFIKITSPNFIYLNELFSNRLELQWFTVHIYHVRMVGYNNIMPIIQNLKFENNNQNVYIDNSYLLMALMCGIIGFIIFYLILIKVGYILYKYNNYLLIVLFASLIIYSFTEIFFFNIDIYEPIICAFILNHYSNINKKLIVINK